MKRGGGNTNSAELLLLKFLPLTLIPSQPFLGCHLGFHIFFHPGLFGGCTLFLQLGCFGLDITSFCIASHKASHQLALVLPFNLFLFLHCRNCGTKARSNYVYTFLSDYMFVYFTLNDIYYICNKMISYITEL